MKLVAQYQTVRSICKDAVLAQILKVRPTFG